MTWLALHAEVIAGFSRLTNHSDLWSVRGWSRNWMQRTPVSNREPIKCAGCGVEFVPRHGLRLFCTIACKGHGPAMQRAHQKYALRRSLERLEARGNRSCAEPSCGKMFTGKRSDSLYCSHACSERRRARDYQRRKAAAKRVNHV